MSDPQRKSSTNVTGPLQGRNGFPGGSIASQKRKRSPRITLACEICRKRKVRCDGDGLNPCPGCIKAAGPTTQCVYIPSTHTNAPKAFRSLERPSISHAHHTSVDASPHHLAAAPQRSHETSQAVGPPLEPPSTVSTSVHTNQSLQPADHLDGDGVRESGFTLLHDVRNTTPSIAIDREPRADGADGCGSVNQYTKGTEFYGDTGIFPFLARLRRYAQSQTKRRDQQGISIVSYLHNTDYPVSATTPKFPPSSHNLRTSEVICGPPNGYLTSEMLRPIELRCITLFFSNLHLIHPILDKLEFLARCKVEVWTAPGDGYQGNSGGFQAVYYAVLALGAIVASEDDLISELPDTPLGIAAADTRLRDVQPPSTLAKLFFERSKASLGDIFDVSSLDTTQALFLLSVFCQNALKPHSCYLFSGMAARTAVAIGLPNAKHGKASVDSKYLRTAVLTWWCIYMHEVEMCCASGRDSSLKSPIHYDLPLPDDDCNSPNGGASDTDNAFISVSVSIANLLKQASEELYQSASITLSSCSVKAHGLDGALERWKDDVPSPLNYTEVSLTEPERVSKQKTVLKLRYLSARILIYRKFVETWSSHPETRFKPEVNECLNAARSTIQLLYETYLHRPYFRTWWYNTTYLLNASMITLYVYFIGAHLAATSDIFHDVEKALDVFDAMGSVVVARRCAKLIREMYDAAKVVHQSRSASSNSLAHGARLPSTMGQPSCAQAEQASFVDSREGSSGHDFPHLGIQDDFGDNNDIFPPADMILDFGFGDAFWNLDGDIDVDFSGGETLQHDNFGNS